MLNLLATLALWNLSLDAVKRTEALETAWRPKLCSMKMKSGMNEFSPTSNLDLVSLKTLIILLVRKEIAVAFSHWLLTPKHGSPKLVVCEILRERCIRAWSKEEAPASLQRGQPEEMWEDANTSMGGSKITALWMYRNDEQWAARTILIKHVCFCDFT